MTQIWQCLMSLLSIFFIDKFKKYWPPISKYISNHQPKNQKSNLNLKEQEEEHRSPKAKHMIIQHRALTVLPCATPKPHLNRSANCATPSQNFVKFQHGLSVPFHWRAPSCRLAGRYSIFTSNLPHRFLTCKYDN